MKRKFLGLICLLLIIIPCSVMLAACKKEEEPVNIVGKYYVSSVVWTEEGEKFSLTKDKLLELQAKEEITEEEEELLGPAYMFDVSFEIKEDGTCMFVPVEGLDPFLCSWRVENNMVIFTKDENTQYKFRIDNEKLIMEQEAGGDCIIFTFAKI